MRPIPNKKTTLLINNRHGFTLIEILVAIVLMAIAVGLFISNPFSSRPDLENEVRFLKRGIRFMSDEAALKNAVIRLHFILNTDPQEYAIEFGPSDSFLLPPQKDFETKTETKEEEDKKNESLKKLNMKFNKVQEFLEENRKLAGNIKIIAIGTSQSKMLQTKGEVALYAFPSGERDQALIILGSDEEVVSININSFDQKMEHQYYPLEETDEKKIKSAQQARAAEIFQKWQKEN